MTPSTPIMNPTQPRKSPPAGFALWQLGFRPFYLAASAFACVSVALWAMQYVGWLSWAYLPSPIWHAHELLFGYALAVVVGFLFTAGRNWSGQPTPAGRGLMALVLLWAAGRVLVASPWPLASALVNAAFPLAAAIGLARALVAARNRRNYFFVGLLGLLAVGQLGMHLSMMGAVELPAVMGLRLGLDVLLLTMAVMGGRVIPMFTHNALPHARARRLAWLERIALGALWGLMAIDLMPWQGTGAAIALALVACVHLLRLLLWQPWKTVGTPLLWVLHVGYLWIPVHLALRALHELGLVSAQLATHALTVGAIGGLTIGMMTRTALGHTGRPLRAGNWELGAYLAIFGAALVRVGGPLAWPAAYGATVWLAALLWCVGFSCYLVRYLPILTRPRVDGRPG